MLKRIIAVLLLAACCLAVLPSCGNGLMKIEGRMWKLSRVMYMHDGHYSVIAVGEADSAYPLAKVVDLRLVAKNGQLTIADTTNDQSYQGTYTATGEHKNGTTYNVTLDGWDGFASAIPGQNEDGSEQPTLSLSLGDYSLYFYEVEG